MFGQLPTNVLIDFPSGKYGFVGSVSFPLTYANEDGSIPVLSAEDHQLLARANYPALVKKSLGLVTRVFDTPEDARVFAADLGLEITESVSLN